MGDFEKKLEKVETGLADKSLSLETGKLANLATGSVVLRFGDNVFLSCITASDKPNLDANFFPLTCAFDEKFYAGGKIKGSRFIKREGRPSTDAIINSRLIDRPVRPLFPKGTLNEIQIVVTPLSIDKEIPSGSMAISAAGAAIAVSGIPFSGPIAAVRVGMIDGRCILEPSYDQIN